MLDRSTPPLYQVIDHIDIPKVQSKYLENGVALHVLNAGEQPVIRIELIFPAGHTVDEKKGCSYFTVKMLGEGTKHRSSKEITAYIDQFGAFIDYNHGVDRVSISLFTLSKYLKDLLPILKELILEPVFPENELNNIKNITIQNLKVNQEKNSFVASRKFRELLFGVNHPYSSNLEEEHILLIEPEDLKQHFEKSIFQQKFDVFLVGKVGADEIALVDTYFGKMNFNPPLQDKPEVVFQRSPELHHIVSKDDALQSSIRIGRELFTKSHPDYFKMAVTNEIFGGYFGSRLMKNIREEKGFTYGIYSSIVN